jgi:hypothetical protein
MVLDLGVKPGTFEILCARIVSVPFLCVAAILNRPRSYEVPSKFFSDLSDVLVQLVTLADLVFVDGDVNVKLQ